MERIVLLILVGVLCAVCFFNGLVIWQQRQESRQHAEIEREVGKINQKLRLISEQLEKKPYKLEKAKGPKFLGKENRK